MAVIIPLRKPRFNALTYSRRPSYDRLVEEVEWYSDAGEHVLGLVALDRTDNDWTYVILARDHHSLFRAIEVDINFPDVGTARQACLTALEQHAEQRPLQPRQTDNNKKSVIFDRVVQTENLHLNFRRLDEDEGYSPAKGIIEEIAYAFEDPDGNYIQQFQSTGFDARLWELYLYAYLHEAGFQIDRAHSAPDYTCEKSGVRVCIEAVTVNPTQESEGVPHTTSDDLQQRLRDFMPIKFGSSLFSKLNKRYWEKAHVRGNPLMFAIHDFHKEQSMLWSGSALMDYLYGVHHTAKKDAAGNLLIETEEIQSHKHGNKEIPSGFFYLPQAEHVSAVLFSNSATISKFNRMGKIAGFGSRGVTMRRVGTCYDHDPNAAVPKVFTVFVDDTYQEEWGQGLSMYHNPTALHPIPRELFPDIAHHYLEDGQLASFMPSFFPYASLTYVFVEKPATATR